MARLSLNMLALLQLLPLSTALVVGRVPGRAAGRVPGHVRRSSIVRRGPAATSQVFIDYCKNTKIFIGAVAYCADSERNDKVDNSILNLKTN